jgi:hypothetical protein
MQEEIFGEGVEDGVLGAIIGELQAQPNPQAADDAEKKAHAYLQGQTGGNPAPSVGQASPALLAGGPQGPPAGPPNGAPPPLPAGSSAPPPAGPPPQAPQGPPPQGATGGNSNTVSLEEAQSAFQQVQGLVGRVFLVGEIVIRGETDSDIEVALTDKADQDT